MSKNTEAILQSQRDKKIIKERQRQIKKTTTKKFGKKFEDLVNFQHDHGGRTDVKRRENKKISYWVKNQRRIYCQFLRDDHTPPTPEGNPTRENIGFVWTVENVNAGKRPIRKKNEIPDD